MGQAHVASLEEQDGLSAKTLRGQWVQLLARIRTAVATTAFPAVRAGLQHFLKVSKSYWPGLFRCYESADVPRTNNDLEHTFGSHRYHERRASGRRRASPGLVVVGAARAHFELGDAAAAGRGAEIPPGYVNGWQDLRARLESRGVAPQTAAFPMRSSGISRSA